MPEKSDERHAKFCKGMDAEHCNCMRGPRANAARARAKTKARAERVKQLLDALWEELEAMGAAGEGNNGQVLEVI